MKGRTSFVIAHRLSTIRRADKVLVINNGEILERGTHGELLEMKGFYYRMYMSQFKGTHSEQGFERIEPGEPSTPIMPPMGMPEIPGRRGLIGRGGMGGMPDMFRRRIVEIAETFRKKGALSPETALSPEQLGLPPQFKMMMQMGMVEVGLFLEHEGKYYLSEKRLNQMQES
jgi:hypothetical protein